MKRLIVLFTLLCGVCAFAQHPLSAERQALIRKLSLPVLADTLEYARKNKERVVEDFLLSDAKISG